MTLLRDGKEKWTAYKFTKTSTIHECRFNTKRICSAIDDLPSGIDFGLSQSASFSQSEPQTSQQSNAESVGMLEEDEPTKPCGLASHTDYLFTQAAEQYLRNQGINVLQVSSAEISKQKAGHLQAVSNSAFEAMVRFRLVVIG
jgi:hypothetical protein